MNGRSRAEIEEAGFEALQRLYAAAVAFDHDIGTSLFRLSAR
jgi:hypothetical protein